MADVRTRILEAATQQFAQRGFHGTSLSAVAGAVGIRKPSLLYHFASKDALRDAVLDGMLSRWRESLPAVLVAAGSGAYRLDAAISALAEFFLADPNRARLIVREVLDRPEEVRHRLEAHLAPWTGFIVDYIRVQRQRGHAHPGIDPEAFVVLVVQMVLGSIAAGEVAASMLGTRHASRDDQIREVVRISRAALFLPQSQEG